MKRTKGVLTMILIGTFVTSLFSCAKQPEGKIVSVRYTVGSMSYADSFSFVLTERDGEVFFTCDTQASDGERIELDEVSVDPGVMEEFRRRASDSEIAEAVLSYKKPHRKPNAADAPSRTFTLKWEDGTERTAEQDPPDADELRAFFVSVAEKYADGASKVPTGQLVAYGVSAAASWIEGCYYFDLMLDGGRWLLSAQFTEIIQTADGQWDSQDFRFEDEPITPGSAERIRAAAEEVGLRERLTAAANRWTPSDDEEEMFPLDATSYSIYASWDDGVSLSDSGYGDPPQDALFEALKDAAKEAAQSNQ